MKQCMIGVYRPPKASRANDYIRLEEELNDVLGIASEGVISNHSGLRLDQREGKILRDLQEVRGLEYLQLPCQPG